MEALQRNASTKPIWDGMIEANQLAIGCLKSLKDTNWVKNSQMSEDNLKKFLEFLLSVSHSREGLLFFSHFKLQTRIKGCGFCVRVSGQNAGTPP